SIQSTSSKLCSRLRTRRILPQAAGRPSPMSFHSTWRAYPWVREYRANVPRVISRSCACLAAPIEHSTRLCGGAVTRTIVAVGAVVGIASYPEFRIVRRLPVGIPFTAGGPYCRCMQAPPTLDELGQRLEVLSDRFPRIARQYRIPA